MFDGLSPEVKALLKAAGADLPTAKADAGLLRAMAEAVSVEATDATSPLPRRRSMLGKILTAKAAALAGVLVLSGGAASAATGALPDPAQDAVHEAAQRVGFDLPRGHGPKADRGKPERVKSDAEEAPETDQDKVKTEHPENHGKDVSTVAHDPATKGSDHGAAVCAVASDGKCKAGEDKPDTDTDTDGDSAEKGKSAEHRKDAEHRGEKPTPSTTTSTTTAP